MTTVGRDRVEPDSQRVARFSSLDVERPGLWVAAVMDPLAGGVAPASVDRRRDNRVAIGNPQDWIVAANR